MHGQDAGLTFDAALTFGELHLDVSRRTVFLAKQSVRVTRTEFELLTCLMQANGAVRTRDELIEALWGPKWFGDGHQLEVHVSRLRTKLLDAGGHSGLITSVRGVGYRLVAARDHKDGTAREVESASSSTVTTLVYDHELTLVAVAPQGEVFLGWSPVDVIGTYHVLTTSSQLYESQPAGLRLVHTLLASGITEWTTRMPLRTADGSEALHWVVTRLHSDSQGKFSGMTAEIT